MTGILIIESSKLKVEGPRDFPEGYRFEQKAESKKLKA